MSDQNSAKTDTEMYVSAPLYKDVDLRSLDIDARTDFVERLRYPVDSIDAHCVECKCSSTFRLAQSSLQRRLGREELMKNGVFEVEFECSRHNTHKLYFVFLLQDGCLTKIGQYPSYATLSGDDIKQYRKILGEEMFQELRKAIGLASHDTAIGAFVYLRRILENLIEAAHSAARSEDPSWNEDAYQSRRAAEKIEVLSGYLPDFLVENRSVYSILSKGIHELSEEECRQFFGTVKVAIELILDEQLEKQKKKQKLKQAKLELDAIRKAIS